MERHHHAIAISSAHRLEAYYKQTHLWKKAVQCNRLVWFDDGRSIIYVRSGTDFTLEKFARGGWVLLIADENLEFFFQHYPFYRNSLLFDVNRGDISIQPTKLLLLELGLFADQMASQSAATLPHLIQPYVDLILVKVVEAYALVHPTPLTDWQSVMIREFKSLVERHFKDRRFKTKAYADALSTAAASLNKLCATRIGKNVKDYCDSLRIAYARKQLLTSTDTIKEIAHVLGFEENQGHFSTYFKRHTGQTPEQCRGLLSQSA